jgi:glutaredoxin 2
LPLCSETKTEFGCRQFATPHVQELWQAKKEKKFCLFKQNFPNIYEAKLKESNFFDAQMKQLFEDHD